MRGRPISATVQLAGEVARGRAVNGQPEKKHRSNATCRNRVAVYFESMNKPKPPSDTPTPSQPDQPDPPATPVPPTTGLNPMGYCMVGRADANPKPVIQTPELDMVDGFRVANTPGGLLALRDPQRLRRHVLAAPDEAEQERRQRELLELASSSLSFWPTSVSDSSAPQTSWRPNSRITNVGLWAWPVLVSHANLASVVQTFCLGPSGPGSLATEVTRAWAMALGVPDTDVRVEGAVSVQRLTDLSPLMLQSTLSRESRRLNAFASGSAASVGADLLPPGAQSATPWSLALAPSQEKTLQFAPDRPLVFLLTAFVAWDCALAHPVGQPKLQAAKARMGQLMSALFTQGCQAPGPVVHPDGKCSKAVVTKWPRERTALPPVICMGQPQTLYEAVTQGQWLQLAWMAERARRTGRQFTLSQRQQGSYVTWVARIGHDGDDEDNPGTELRYTYDGFWRPLGHVQVIQRCVDQAQGSGQMPGEDLFSHPGH